MRELSNALTHLSVKNFKSLKSVEIKPGRVNVFIGKPNAGKTNFLEALIFLGTNFRHKAKILKSDIRFTDMASLFYGQSLNENIRIETNRLTCDLSGGYKNLFSFISTKDAKELNKITNHIIEDPHSLVLDTDKTNRLVFNNRGSSEQVTAMIDSGIKKYQFVSGKNSLSVGGVSIWNIINHNSHLKNFAKDFFKEFSLEVLYDVKQNKMNIMRKSEDSYYLIDFSMTPDTFQRMLYYLAVIEANKNSVILLEEPEAQSYPPYIQMLAERIVDDKDNQYFITTHSPFIVEKMLQHSGKGDDVKIFVTYFEDYQTKVHELISNEIDYIISNSVDLFFNIESFQK